MTTNPLISGENLDHLGIIAGLVDDIGIVEQLNQRLGVDKERKSKPWSSGQSDAAQWTRFCISTTILIRAILFWQSDRTVIRRRNKTKVFE